MDVTDHYFLISAQKENTVLLFKRSGEFIRQIGRQGRGPGEFQYPHYACMDPQERFIIIKDAAGGNLFKFDLNGKILKQISTWDICPTNVNWQPVFINSNHFALSYNRPLIPKDNHYNVAIFDLDLNLVERTIPIANNDSLCLMGLSGQQVLQSRNDILYWEGFVDTIFSINLGQKPKPKYHFNLEGTGRSLGFLTGQDRRKEGQQYNSISGILEFSDYLFFVLYNEGRYPMVYDKKRKDAFTLADDQDCVFSSSHEYRSARWDNNIYGFPNVPLNYYFPDQNMVASYIDLGSISHEDLECMKRKNVKLPEKRDQLVKMIESYTGEELPLLVLLHYR